MSEEEAYTTDLNAILIRWMGKIEWTRAIHGRGKKPEPSRRPYLDKHGEAPKLTPRAFDRTFIRQR